jgi:hypothetical protein
MKALNYLRISLLVFAASSISAHAAPQIIDTALKDSARERVMPVRIRIPDGE